MKKLNEKELEILKIIKDSGLKKSNNKYYYTVPTDIRRNGQMLITEKSLKVLRDNGFISLENKYIKGL